MWQNGERERRERDRDITHALAHVATHNSIVHLYIYTECNSGCVIIARMLLQFSSYTLTQVHH